MAASIMGRGAGAGREEGRGPDPGTVVLNALRAALDASMLIEARMNAKTEMFRESDGTYSPVTVNRYRELTLRDPEFEATRAGMREAFAIIGRHATALAKQAAAGSLPPEIRHELIVARNLLAGVAEAPATGIVMAYLNPNAQVWNGRLIREAVYGALSPSDGRRALRRIAQREQARAREESQTAIEQRRQQSGSAASPDGVGRLQRTS